MFEYDLTYLSLYVTQREEHIHRHLHTDSRVLDDQAGVVSLLYISVSLSGSAKYRLYKTPWEGRGNDSTLPIWLFVFGTFKKLITKTQKKYYFFPSKHILMMDEFYFYFNKNFKTGDFLILFKTL